MLIEEPDDKVALLMRVDNSCEVDLLVLDEAGQDGMNSMR